MAGVGHLRVAARRLPDAGMAAVDDGIACNRREHDCRAAVTDESVEVRMSILDPRRDETKEGYSLFKPSQ